MFNHNHLGAVTLINPVNVSDLPPSVLSFSSILTLGTMNRRSMATTRVTDPTLKKGRVNPPTPYKADPNAGPEHLTQNYYVRMELFCALKLLLMVWSILQ